MEMTDLEACAADHEAAKQVDADTWSYDLGAGWTAHFNRDGGMTLRGEFPEDCISLDKYRVARLRRIVNGEARS